MATTADRGGGSPKKKVMPKSISSSVLYKAEKLKRKLQECLRHHRKPGFPHTLGHMTLYDIRLPDLTCRSRELVAKLLIDRIMQEDLEETQIINFCKFTATLYALKTAGDGNCLLHAVSLAIWGIHDKAMLLRRLVYISLVEDAQTQAFYKRWQRERVRLNAAVPHGMELTSGQWSSEWGLVVQAAEDCERSATNPGDLPFEALEEIHIFVLANVIQRPIVVLADSFVRSVHGSLLGPSNFSGIYLPLLWEVGKCSKVPIILGYHTGHFTPLVTMEQGQPTGEQPLGEYAVPLVNKDMEPLYIHFLLEEEEIIAVDILQRYVKVTELNWQKDGHGLHSSLWLLCAKLEHTKIEEEYDLMTDYICEMEKQSANRKSTHNPKQKNRSQSAEGRSASKTKPERPAHSDESLIERQRVAKEYDHFKEGSAKHSHVVKEQRSKPTNRTREKTSPAQSPRRQLAMPKRSAKLCVKDGCQYYGSLEYGGLCYGCFMKKTMNYQPSSRQESIVDIQYIPSVSGDNCAHGSCTYMASRNTYPYCHEHARSNQLSPAIRTVSENLQSLYIPSITDRECSHPACSNMASTKTFPYCHEHKKDLQRSQVKQSYSREPVIHSEVEHLHQRNIGLVDHTSMTPYNCNRHGCTNVASSHTFPFCHEHYSGQRDPAASVSDQVEEPQEDDEPSIRDFLCNRSGCANRATVETYPYCAEHHTQVIPLKSSGADADWRRDEHRHARNDIEQDPRYESLSNYKAGSSRECPVPGCVCYGPPASDYYCPEHYRHHKSKQQESLEYRTSRKATGKDCCVKASCDGQGNLKYNGLCSNCYIQDGFSTSSHERGYSEYPLNDLFPSDHQNQASRTVKKSNVSERHNSWEQVRKSDPPHEGLQRQESETKSTASLQDVQRDSTCIAPNCNNQSRPELKGLCEECYHFLSNKPQNPSLGEDGFEDSTVPSSRVIGHQLSRKSTSFREKGTHLPSHRQNGLDRSLSTTQFRHSRKQTSVAQETPLLLQNGTIPKRLHNNQKTSAQEETARWVSKLNLRPNDDDDHENVGFVALQRLENKARVSTRKCKRKGCNNFGNVSKNGYCNTCHELTSIIQVARP